VRILLFSSHPLVGQQTASHGPAMRSHPSYHGARTGQPEFASPADPAQAGL